MKTQSTIGILIALLTCCGTLHAADFYASTSGSPAADGSFADPWDLETALHHPPALQAGDTIWVRGGTYDGAHTSLLAGDPGNPITVRAYRRERVVLDYADNSNCNPGETDECSPSNKRCNALTVPACSHDVVFRDLELTQSAASGRISLPAGGCTDAPECCYVDGVAPPLKAECSATAPGIARAQWQPLHIAGDRVKVVNCIVHDGGNGITTDQKALDTEIYGGLVFNNGWADPASGQGHGISLENLSPSWRESRKQVRNTVLWNNFGDGVRSATTWGHFSNNLSWEDVVSFNNGAPTAAFYATDPVLYAAAQNTRYANAFVQADEKMRFIQLHRCRLYHPQGSAVQRQHLGGIKNADFEFSKDIILEDSYIATSGTPLGLIRWDRMRTTGTTLVGGASPQVGDTEALVEIEKTECASLFNPTSDWDAIAWEDNHYFFTGAGTQPFGLKTSAAWSYMSFAAWRTAIFNRDATSTYATGLPTSNAVFVQPNAYEPGRAHVAVYNWQGLGAVGVDLSSLGLVAGQGFRIYNVQGFDDGATSDPFGSVVAGGNFNPAQPVVSVPMTDTTVAGPTGFAYSVASTLPQFGAFLVRSTPCGDGQPDAGEICDDGNVVSGDGCDSNCTATACGNGVVSPGEQCDDGNLINGDGCSADCTVPPTSTPTVTLTRTPTLTQTFTLTPTVTRTVTHTVTQTYTQTPTPTRIAGCGDGTVGGGEACDDGNAFNDDTCDNNCTVPACGNGVVNTGESCDDDNLVDGDGCDSNCRPTGCGNGLTTAGESCDDGNAVDGDGCDSNCTLSACGNGAVAPGEQCDDGNMSDGDGCDTGCTFTAVSVGGSVLPGANVTTDTGGGATEASPLQLTVTTPSGGAIEIALSSGPTTPLAGYAVLGQQIAISAPSETAAQPLNIDFLVDASLLPPGALPSDLTVVRNGVPVADCSDASGTATPDPCVSERQMLGSGDIAVRVLTSEASDWAVVLPEHDSVMAPVKPVKVTIPPGKQTVVRKLNVAIFNPSLARGTTALVTATTTCPGATLTTPDFQPRTAGFQNTRFLPAGTGAKATVALTIASSGIRTMQTLNGKAPVRCAVTFETSIIEPTASIDPAPTNNSYTAYVDVIDKSDVGTATSHESVLRPIPPVKIKIPDGATSLAKKAKVVVVNADFLPLPETPGHEITLIVSDGSCPSGTVGAVDYNKTMPGIQSSVTVKGGLTRAGMVPLTIHPGSFNSPSPRSPARCTALLSVAGPGGDADASNDVSRLVIDVVDQNDF